MARPFPTTFDQDPSINPQSDNSAPISYQANVNRQKTKKWTDAKPVSYGGDDWGDDDDYDDYEEPLPPPPKPTGLRQQGHTLQGPATATSPIDSNKKNYGDLPAIPAPGNTRPRANSFDTDDEKRDFSSNAASIAQQAGAPATRFSQITGLPTVRDTSGPPPLSVSTQQGQATAPRQVRSPIAETTYADTRVGDQRASAGFNPTASPSSDTRPSSDYQARRDYSPTAVPAPLTTRSPIPQSGTDLPERFPARKSSLSQTVAPTLTEIMGSSQEASSSSKPWSPGRDSSPGFKVSSPPTATPKALPFIRPADIYRRAEERRQSLESGGRPSLDSVGAQRPGDRSDSPGKPILREKLSSESIGRRQATNEGVEAPASNRHLLPVLEPVKERKSEYGFEGFSISESAPNPVQERPLSNSAQLDVQQTRRQSTSPKLPDLNRMSGFGMDMFAPKTDTPSPQVPNVPVGHSSIPLSQDSPLPRQPSIGLRSVVNQAFDRADDSSVPPTPASGTSSDVRRTDSASTGTGGISPIMNSGPGAYDTAPSILEVVNEERRKETPPSESVVPGFKPGHRRDISTPSPGNSPARTPDIGIVKDYSQGQQATLSDRDTSESLYHNLPPPRPTPQSEDSFRPVLPGGWESYATSARTQTPQPEDKPTTQDQDDVAEVGELTPTATRRSPPQSVLGVAAGGGIGSDAARGMHDQDGAVTSSFQNRGPQSDSLPTPDLSMAPGGNLYSASSVDPRLLPQVEKAPPETQLRPDVVDRSLPTDLRDAPPPPPKDTPIITQGSEAAGYFPLSTPQRKDSVDSWENSNDEADSPVRQSVPPVITSVEPADEDENERLRDEIVKRLSLQPSPQLSETKPVDGNLLASQPSDTARESTYLPAEYGDYWASTNDDQAGRPLSGAYKDEQSQVEGTTSSMRDDIVEGDLGARSIAPLNVNREHTPIEDRPALKPRFSWEQSSEVVSKPADSEVSLPPVSSDAHEQTESSTIASPDNVHTGTPGAEQLSAPSYADEKIPVGHDHPSVARTSSVDHHVGSDAAILGGSAALAAGAVAAVATGNSRPPERRLSLAEEKATRVSSYPVTATPPEDEHPSRSPQPYLSSATDEPSFTQPPSTTSPVNAPISPATGRLWAFKEIVAMKSPHQRIQTFDETRQRFAAMDSGLSDWMSTLRAQYPEHESATRSWNGSSVAGPGKAKLNTKPGAASQPLQQPYYQQYLNASSPSSPSTPTSKPGPSAPAAYQQQGFSPAGATKLTTQQVQAKGKEFLHTAGIFGGKAGKAGKGLLAKGKNKLRGSGGDKSSPPPKSKNDRRSSWGFPLAHSKSSGQPDSSSAHISRENTPVPIHDQPRSNTMSSIKSVPPQLPPAAATESFGSLSEVVPSSTSQTARNSSPPVLAPINLQLTPSNEPITTVREIRDADQSTTESERQDSVERQHERQHESGEAVFVPAPISKSQPSWDPYNATPIAEEPGSACDIHPAPKSYPFPSTSTLQPPAPTLSISPETIPKSDRSNSEDAHFHDAVEDQGDIKSDWVMVDANATPQPPAIAEDQPPISMMHRPRGSHYETPTQPLPVKAENQGVPVQHETPNTDIQSGLPYNPSHDKSVLQHAPLQQQQNEQQYQKQNVTPHSQEGHGSDSTFLPPMRRTSTFGFKFGPRQPKERFLIDDEYDDDKGATGPPGDSAPVIHDTGAGNIEHVQRRDQNAQQVNDLLPGQPGESRPPLIQATSSEYSQRTQEEVKKASSPHFQADVSRPSLDRRPSSERHSSITNVQHGGQPSASRPVLTSARSSEHSQRTLTQQQIPDQGRHTRTEEFPPPPEAFRRSQDAWRPNAVSTPPAQVSPRKPNIPMSAVPPRNSWEHQRPRGSSGTGQNFPPRLDADRIQWIPQQSKAFEQPPSSAQRYPELFRSEPSSFDGYDKESGDLPPHYYQTPITREAAFLPRQQTNEYQLSGVGPPADEPRENSRRNSGFFKEIGGRISRATSRERGKSISREDSFAPSARTESRENEYADSSIASEDGREQNKRRSGFFRGINRSSTGALNAPHSRESTVAHNPGSRTDLSSTPEPSPNTTQDKRRSILGSSPSNTPKTSKLSRASTSGLSDMGKKKRFSGLTGFFGKSNTSRNSLTDRPQFTREVSHNERQPIESPQFGPRAHDRQQAYPQEQINRMTSPAQSTPSPPVNFQTQQPPSSTQGSRHFLSQTTPNISSPQFQQESRPRKSSKTRRASASGLLNGFLGRKSNQPDGKSDTSQSQASQQQNPRFVPPPQTYSDLQDDTPRQPVIQPRAVEQQHMQTQASPYQDRTQRGRDTIPQERGRQSSREPQYDSVPIPGGYSLVRGQGARAVTTDYDPRGLRSQLVQPQPAQIVSTQDSSSAQGRTQQPSSPQQSLQRSSPASQHIAQLQTQSLPPKHAPPSLSSLNTHDANQLRRSSHRLSREDLIARSPARSPGGQQRPYQLSLPEDDDDRDYPVNQNRGPVVQTSGSSRSPFSNVLPAQKLQNGAIQRLQGAQMAPPQLRHPESPAGYPLPDDLLFSPVNPAAHDIPPPPPPKDDDTRHGQDFRNSLTRGLPQNSYLTSTDLNRSATHRTTVSAVSGMSDPPNSDISPRRESAGLTAPHRKPAQEADRSVSSPSPTPPSPAGTPVRLESPDPNYKTKTTIINTPIRRSLDLYDASPRLNHTPGNTKTNGHAQSGPSNLHQGNTPNRANSRSLAELEGTKADGFQMKVRPQEEKIFYDAESGARGPHGRQADDNAVSMSATSYPGQEWNPYGGGFDDDSR